MEKLSVNGVVIAQKLLMSKMNEYNLPEHMCLGMSNYLLHHIQPGSFMTAVLSNNLRESVACADEINSRLLKEWVMFMYNELPADSWGSPEKVNNWLSKREVK